MNLGFPAMPFFTSKEKSVVTIPSSLSNPTPTTSTPRPEEVYAQQFGVAFADTGSARLDKIRAPVLYDVGYTRHILTFCHQTTPSLGS